MAGELMLEFRIPPGTSKRKAIYLLRKFVAGCDAIHRSCGGSGLKLEKLEAFVRHGKG